MACLPTDIILYSNLDRIFNLKYEKSVLTYMKYEIMDLNNNYHPNLRS